MSGVLFDVVHVDYFRLPKFQRFLVILQRCHLISLYFALVTLLYFMFKNVNQLFNKPYWICYFWKLDNPKFILALWVFLHLERRKFNFSLSRCEASVQQDSNFSPTLKMRKERTGKGKGKERPLLKSCLKSTSSYFTVKKSSQNKSYFFSSRVFVQPQPTWLIVLQKWCWVNTSRDTTTASTGNGERCSKAISEQASRWSGERYAQAVKVIW